MAAGESASVHASARPYRRRACVQRVRGDRQDVAGKSFCRRGAGRSRRFYPDYRRLGLTYIAVVDSGDASEVNNNDLSLRLITFSARLLLPTRPLCPVETYYHSYSFRKEFDSGRNIADDLQMFVRLKKETHIITRGRRILTRGGVPCRVVIED